jgi:hypothetical protein
MWEYCFFMKTNAPHRMSSAVTRGLCLALFALATLAGEQRRGHNVDLADDREQFKNEDDFARTDVKMENMPGAGCEFVFPRNRSTLGTREDNEEPHLLRVLVNGSSILPLTHLPTSSQGLVNGHIFPHLLRGW